MRPDSFLIAVSVLYTAVTMAVVGYGLVVAPPRSAETQPSMRTRRRSCLEGIFLFARYAALLWFFLPARGFGLGEGQVVALLASVLLAVVSAMSWLTAEIERLLRRGHR